MLTVSTLNLLLSYHFLGGLARAAGHFIIQDAAGQLDFGTDAGLVEPLSASDVALEQYFSGFIEDGQADLIVLGQVKPDGGGVGEGVGLVLKEDKPFYCRLVGSFVKLQGWLERVASGVISQSRSGGISQCEQFAQLTGGQRAKAQREPGPVSRCLFAVPRMGELVLLGEMSEMPFVHAFDAG